MRILWEVCIQTRWELLPGNFYLLQEDKGWHGYCLSLETTAALVMNVIFLPSGRNWEENGL